MGLLGGVKGLCKRNMLKFIIILIAGIAFAYFAYVNFDQTFGDDPAVVESRQK